MYFHDICLGLLSLLAFNSFQDTLDIFTIVCNWAVKMILHNRFVYNPQCAFFPFIFCYSVCPYLCTQFQLGDWRVDDFISKIKLMGGG